jgi:hypothetical protein
MNRCSRIIFLLLACAVLAGPARAGEGTFSDVSVRALKCGVYVGTVDDLHSRVAEGTMTEEQAAALLTPLLDACVDQLPLAPFEDKLAEGLTKRVPPERIVPVLKRWLDQYRFARKLLLTTRGSLPTEALMLLGEGLTKGVPEEDFETYMTEFGGQPDASFLTGLAMISYQGQAGFDASLTRRILAQGAEGGGIGPKWRYFVRIILAARRRGVDDQAIASAAVDALREGEPVSGVVTRLGFTGRSLTGETADR